MDMLAPTPPRSTTLPRWRRARRRAFAWSVRGVAGAVARAPRPLAVGGMRTLARIAWATRPRDRAIARRQLAWAFPELPEAERDGLARTSLRRLGENLVDSVRGDRVARLRPSDRERFRALGADARPVVYLTAHLGAWELLGRFLAVHTPGLGVLTANPHNDAVYQWLRASREAHGLHTFDRDRQALAAARWLGRGRPLAILADLRSRGAAVDAEWFGHPVPTLVSPGRLARRFGARVVAVGIRRRGDAHEVFLGPEIPVDPEGSDLEWARRANAGLETLLREAPEEWVWFHDRVGRRER